MPVEIKNRDNGRVRLTVEADNLIGADLPRVNLTRADLQRADLQGANLSGADLSGANLTRANLSGANLSRSNLSGANLSGANLRRANLSGANLRKTDLRHANLRKTDLRGVNLHDCTGNGCEVKDAFFDTWRITWTEHAVQIGCEHHPWDEWLAFDDEAIDGMHDPTLAWWRKWKPVLEQLIAAARNKRAA